MAEEPLAQASEPMLRSNSHGKPPDTHHPRSVWQKRLAFFSPVASPAGQLCLAYLIYILGPGLYWNIFSAIPSFEFTVNTALIFTRWKVRATEYALPSVVGFISGILINKLGPKYTLLVGCVGYPLKIAAYLSNNNTYRERYFECYLGSGDCYSSFEEFAGILLAICQGLSGSVVPYLMLVYPTANSKGLAIASFLGLWSLFALIGAAIKFFSIRESTALAYYSYFYKNTEADAVWYAPFLVLAILATCLCLSIVNIKRSPASSVVLSRTPKNNRTWRDLTGELWRDIFANPHMLALLPMFFVSTWFYGYQFAKANSGIQFTLRAQALNLILYWSMSTFGSLVFGVTLDTARIGRKTRARLAWLVLLFLTIPIWSGGSVFQAKADSYEYSFLTSGEYSGPLDPERKSYWYHGAVLFLFYGLHSAAWQVVSYWQVSLTDDSHRLANYAGVYNAAQSAGNAVIWRLVSPGAYVVGFEYATNRSVFDAVWALAIASLLIAAPTFFSGVRDVPPSEGLYLASSSTREAEVDAGALPIGGGAVETTSAAVALPQGGALQTFEKTRPAVSKAFSCVLYALISSIVLLPIVLATLGTLVNTGGSDGCLPDGTFAIPGKFDIWDPQYVLTLTVGFGRMSFPLAKLLDLSWDIIIGHGGQALLIWVAYKVFTRYIVCLMEHDGVTMQTYTAVSFRTGSLEGAWLLMRDLARRKKLAVPRGVAMMVYIAIYLLVFPAVISAMTSYAPIGNPYVTFELPSGDGLTVNTTVSRPFSEFSLVNQTDGTWSFHNMTNLTTTFMLENAHCTPTNYYRWGFSYLLLFILAVASSIFVTLLVLLQQQDGLVSSVRQAKCYTPGLWRSVMEMSSHARSIVLEQDPEHLSTEQLELELKDTRMTFDKEELAAVQSALAASEVTSDAADRAANLAESDLKKGWMYRAEAVFRRRKGSKGSGMYESPPAQYEGV